ncbi:MAG: TIGR01777 family oxidoreductase [Microscillaceae bacterium]|nr:TIGR01777 family oxidoreductase [Microscillaceae bacterium]MDW8461978.1 TIGR01777 family oxidoreductase [Cytophagales bacterium]
MSQNILITGGTGLIGKALTPLLKNRGYKVSYLSREKKYYPDIDVFRWDIAKKFIEEESLLQADGIIHLAGAGVADKKWTPERKREILESRTKSTELLAEKLQALGKKPEVFVSASAIGIYGADTGDKWLYEESIYGDDFLAEVTKAWERSVGLIEAQEIRTVKLRIGVVLHKERGALPKMAQPIKLGLGASLGSGRQYISWIHWYDLCQMFLFAIENQAIKGVFNAVAPQPVTNTEFTKTLAQVLKRPLLSPIAAPSFMLKLALGEMATMVLGGNRVSCQKIEKAGFQFQFPQLKMALEEIYKVK